MVEYETAKKIVEAFFPALETQYGTSFRVLETPRDDADWGWIIYVDANDRSRLPIDAAHAALPFCRVFVDRVSGFPILSFSFHGTGTQIGELIRYRERILAGETNLIPLEARSSFAIQKDK
jgi:hypothetical protein